MPLQTRSSSSLMSRRDLSRQSSRSELHFYAGDASFDDIHTGSEPEKETRTLFLCHSATVRSFEVDRKDMVVLRRRNGMEFPPFDRELPHKAKKELVGHGAFCVYQIIGQNSTFMKCGNFFHPILPRLRIWRMNARVFIIPQPISCKFWMLELDEDNPEQAPVEDSQVRQAVPQDSGPELIDDLAFALDSCCYYLDIIDEAFPEQAAESRPLDDFAAVLQKKEEMNQRRRQKELKEQEGRRKKAEISMHEVEMKLARKSNGQLPRKVSDYEAKLDELNGVKTTDNTDGPTPSDEHNLTTNVNEKAGNLRLETIASADIQLEESEASSVVEPLQAVDPEITTEPVESIAIVTSNATIATNESNESNQTLVDNGIFESGVEPNIIDKGSNMIASTESTPSSTSTLDKLLDSFTMLTPPHSPLQDQNEVLESLNIPKTRVPPTDLQSTLSASDSPLMASPDLSALSSVSSVEQDDSTLGSATTHLIRQRLSSTTANSTDSSSHLSLVSSAITLGDLSELDHAAQESDITTADTTNDNWLTKHFPIQETTLSPSKTPTPPLSAHHPFIQNTNRLDFLSAPLSQVNQQHQQTEEHQFVSLYSHFSKPVKSRPPMHYALDPSPTIYHQTMAVTGYIAWQMVSKITSPWMR